MAEPLRETPRPAGSSNADYESSPLTRAEYISALVHLYRGEIYRSNSWRIRLDNTTNWAVLTTAGLVTFAFGEGSASSHWVLLVGTAMLSVFMGLEARRYRYADVWRTRVRMIEENFYGPILRRDPASPEEQWGALVAGDLLTPTFKITRLQALRNRFVRNYWSIYTVLFVAWAVKISGKPFTALDTSELRRLLGDGYLLPWWAPLAYVLLLLSALIALVLFTPRITDPISRDWFQDPEPVPGGIDL